MNAKRPSVVIFIIIQLSATNANVINIISKKNNHSGFNSGAIMPVPNTAVINVIIHTLSII